jgi:hypothetical protein
MPERDSWAEACSVRGHMLHVELPVRRKRVDAYPMSDQGDVIDDDHVTAPADRYGLYGLPRRIDPPAR